MADKDKNPKPEDKMTPEEKLFKVIATGGKDYPYPSEDTKPPADLIDQDPFSRLENIWERLKASAVKIWRRNVSGIFKRPLRIREERGGLKTRVVEILALKTLNQVLAVLVGLLGFYLVVDFLFGLGHRPSFKEELGPPALSLTQTADPLKSQDLSHYLEPAQSRNVFTAPTPKGAPPAEITAGTTSGAPPVSFKLVGISWDAKEYVAMIEYEGEKGARFVRKGDSLSNGVKVEEIKEYSVMLSSGGETWELN